MPHAVVCPHCRHSNERPANQGRVEVSCTHCQARFLDLGPLPMPDYEIPMASAMDPELQVQLPDPKTLDELPKYLCPWCGANTGVRKNCRRCSCDLSVCATIDLQRVAAGLSPTEMGAFYQQAMKPISYEVALCRLHRLSPSRVKKIGGTQELANEMRSEPPPPGCPQPGFGIPAKLKGCFGVSLVIIGTSLFLAIQLIKCLVA